MTRSETPGVLIGLSNVMTARRDRVPPGGAPDPARLDRLRLRARRALEGREAYIHDAVLAGRRVRLYSNSHHLADFWRDNFHVETEWRATTGLDVPREPALTVHAIIGVGEEAEASCASGAEVFLFNTSYYQDLRACTLEALARLIPAGDALVHGGAVDLAGRGLVWTYPRELIHPTPTWSLMEGAGAQLVGDGWILQEGSGPVRSLERRLYVRSSLIASHPALAARFIRCKFENVPLPNAAQADALAPLAASLLREALRADSRGALRAWPEAKALDFLLRLIADPDARVLVDPAELYGKTRVLSATRAAVAFELRAGAAGAPAPATVPPFPCPGWTLSAGDDPRALARLMAGRT